MSDSSEKVEVRVEVKIEDVYSMKTTNLILADPIYKSTTFNLALESEMYCNHSTEACSFTFTLVPNIEGVYENDFVYFSYGYNYYLQPVYFDKNLIISVLSRDLKRT